MLEFIEVLNKFGDWLSKNLLQLSIELAILAAVVLVAIWVLRVRSPKWRHLFWCLVLAKPVATFLIASPLSLYWFLQPEPPEPPAPPPALVVGETPANWKMPPMVRPPMAPHGIYEAATPEPVAFWQDLSGRGVASIAWVVIASLFGLRLVVGCAYVGFLRRSAEVQRNGPLADVVRDASRALGVRRRVTVGLSNVAHGPVLAGVFRPVILIPKTRAARLDTTSGFNRSRPARPTGSARHTTPSVTPNAAGMPSSSSRKPRNDSRMKTRGR